MIEGLSHITLIVRDLTRMTSFLTTIFDAEQVYDSGDSTHSLSRERFFLIGGIWLAIMEGEPLPEQTYNHVAFKIPDSDYEKYEQRIRATGAEVRASRSRTAGEGRSLYFHDDDNHLFELHTGTLEERLKAYSRLP
ncbi:MULTISPECIES: FosX/FosE/FosI family fosfomycin resistance hydrolase [unclassified Pseudodesulfovibrio]|uniref:FosX/FosE/FosI family fosfomycin resistance hydrolase n=1 Tax=unclassified Pseudodesulfovibrio TaxID=2661612 RepID=UPI000FEBBB38|nr:FosX/FosE/FosI family fosfomycin resistance hydrolase [Pseudodesulfovibrio sp. S3-i]RWU02330.1 FosX/FosE/FosI family fosfomycin resistance thiol transferase [Pseudodesulfovibrio sp. S3]